jgi:hypothetical protein
MYVNWIGVAEVLDTAGVAGCQVAGCQEPFSSTPRYVERRETHDLAMPALHFRPSSLTAAASRIEYRDGVGGMRRSCTAKKICRTKKA